MTFEVFFDISSPWTYLAFHNLIARRGEIPGPITWRPILVGGVFNAVNPSVYESRRAPVPAKARYMKKDLGDWARAAGLTIHFPPAVFPVNSVKAMRACIVLEPSGQLEAFAAAAFEAYWSREEDISQDAVLARVAATAGVDWTALSGAIQEEPVKTALRANTEELIARGGFGSPTMFVDGGDLYFGNDRLDLAIAAAKSSLTPA